MSEPVCTKCRNEPRVVGQRWGLRCRAEAEKRRRDAVPRVSCGTDRRGQKARVEAWVRAHRGRFERETLTALAIEARQIGLYSRRSAISDIRVSLYSAARRQHLPVMNVNPPTR